MAQKIYAVANDAGETTMVIAETILEAVDLWRAEHYDTEKAEDQPWPVSCSMIYEGMILGMGITA